MRKSVAALGMATVLTLGGGSLASAQTSDNAVAQSEMDSEESDNTGLWGLLGLVGLAGLAGLKRRDDVRTHQTVGTTTR